MKQHPIGELEELVLLAVGAMYEEAYAISILTLIRENAKRSVDVTAIHAVLRRLEKKGFVQSSMGGSTQERGGRRKRLFTLTQTGRQMLDDTMAVRVSLYDKLPKLAFHGVSS